MQSVQLLNVGILPSKKGSYSAGAVVVLKVVGKCRLRGKRHQMNNGSSIKPTPFTISNGECSPSTALRTGLPSVNIGSQNQMESRNLGRCSRSFWKEAFHVIMGNV